VFCSFVQVCGSTVAQVAIDAGGRALFARYSREDESDADSVGVGYLLTAGIDPRGMPALFRRMAEARERDPSLLDSWFATHPLEADRITRTSAVITRLDVATPGTLVRDDPAFDRLRSRLRDVSRSGP
jgi:predicted Zn-dependent protease